MAAQPTQTEAAAVAEQQKPGAVFPAVVDPQFTAFAEELREMVSYFLDYKKGAKRSDGRTERVNEIESHLNATAALIGELVSLDFLDATYFAE